MAAYKTKAFQEGFESSKRFRDDLLTFLKLDEKVAEAISATIDDEDKLRGVKNIGLLVNQICEKANSTTPEISPSLRILSYMGRLLQENEKLSDLLDDLQKDGYFQPDQREKANKLFVKCEKARLLLSRVGIKKHFEHIGAPILDNMNWAINLRLLLKESYSLSITPENYTPEREGLLPIVSLQLRIISLGIENSFNFQMDADSFRNFLKQLNAADKELKLLENLVEKL